EGFLHLRAAHRPAQPRTHVAYPPTSPKVDAASNRASRQIHTPPHDPRPPHPRPPVAYPPASPKVDAASNRSSRQINTPSNYRWCPCSALVTIFPTRMGRVLISANCRKAGKGDRQRV